MPGRWFASLRVRQVLWVLPAAVSTLALLAHPAGGPGDAARLFLALAGPAASWWLGDRWWVRPVIRLTASARRSLAGDVDARSGTTPAEGETNDPARDLDALANRLAELGAQAAQGVRSAAALADVDRRLESALADVRASQERIARQERVNALGQLACGAAHDFNNALLLIIGFSDLLLNQRQLWTNSEQVRGYLLLIRTTASNAAAGVRRLQELDRRRNGVDSWTPVDLPSLMQQVVSLTEPRWKFFTQASGRPVQFDTELLPIPPVRGSEPELRDALTNLVLNAVDALPQGGTIRVRTWRDGGRAALEISDNGTGMTEDVRARCFEPFFTTKGTQGSGLGLAMVHETVRRVISAMVQDVIDETGRRVQRFRPYTADEVRGLGEALIGFGSQMREKNRVLQLFLSRRMYQHERVVAIMARAQRVIRDLFETYLSDPDLLPKEWRQYALEQDKSRYARQVCDFIAGMTDRYAIEQHKTLFDLDPQFR